jgi:hypothetical protein
MPRILCNPKFHYHFHNTSPLVLILNHVIQSTVFHHIYLKSILISPSHLKSGLPSGTPTNAVYALPFAFIRATCSAHPILFCLNFPITFGAKHKSSPTYISAFLLSFHFNFVTKSHVIFRHYLKFPHRNHVCNLWHANITL